MKIQKNKLFAVAILATLTACKGPKDVTETKVEPTIITEPIEEKEPVTRADYSPSETRVNDVLHTKLEVSFDWEKAYLNGKATIDVKPHFYPTKELVLDAKGFDIHKVFLMANGDFQELKYDYDTLFLTIQLDKEYTRNDQYQVYIEYTAKPNELESGGSSAITSDKGLYFINADSSETNKPTQIWTQGETEASSCWFPTIDSPNERMTQEIYITVDEKYKTLSNGLLVVSIDNKNGTRTDHWKQDLNHPPYLAMMAIGDFAVVKDTWKRKNGEEMPVHYYVEKEYEQYAKSIFGKTPKMLTFFSDVLGVEYPWAKYHQIVVRDYVSGAMENTTAVIHGEFLHRTDRELLDSDNESIIAHELFHHWFGDLVTCESWANLPLNESFANYSQYLWDEYEHGRDAADHNAYGEMNGYFMQSGQQGHEHLIRFDHGDKEEMFDAHSYNKGGRILNMLRRYIGDEAFFESLRTYLESNKFQPAEVHNLRMAFEKVTGEDLNWYFNQWFLDKGHPVLKFEQEYDATNGVVNVTVTQKQKFENTPLYRLPIEVDVYANGKVERHRIDVEEVQSTFALPVNGQPDLVNIDAEKVLLCKKTDVKSIEQWAFQYRNAPLYLDRREAITKLGKKSTDIAKKVIVEALDDPYWHIKTMAMKNLKKAIKDTPDAIKAKLINLAKNDPKSSVRSEAIKTLQKHFDDDASLKDLYVNAVKDQSYRVMSSGIKAIAAVDEEQGMKIAKEYEKEDNGSIKTAVAQIYAKHGGEAEHEFFLNSMNSIGGFEKFGFIQTYNSYLRNQSDAEIDKGIKVYEDIAKNSAAWWLKLSGYQMLSGLNTMYEKRQRELTTKIESVEAEGGDQMAKAEHERDLNKAKNQSQKIMDLINKLKEQETDKNVLQYIGSM
jgi:aminopeptidase N